MELKKNFPYKNIRPSQDLILTKLEENWDKYKYFVVEAPTGVGKSAVAKSILSSVNNGFLITATKQLQDQYIKDFPGRDIVSIKGKANYSCNITPKLNCEVGQCVADKDLLKKCKVTKNCKYYNQRERALYSNICLTSYQYMLRSFECAGFWKSRDVIIFDECHLLEQQIVQWASIDLKPRELNEKYGILNGVPFDDFVFLSTPPTTSGLEDNKKFLFKVMDYIKITREAMFEEIKDSLKIKNADELNEDELDELLANHSDYYMLDKFYKKMDIFFKTINYHKDSWLIEPTEDGLALIPIKVDYLFDRFIKKWANKKIIFMSATIINATGFCKTLGLTKENTGVIRIEPNFDPKKSPIIYKPSGKMNYSNIDETMKKIITDVEYIINQHSGEKGIIHTGNYKIAHELFNNIDTNRFIMKEEGETNEDILKKHVKSTRDSILLSPSLTTGTDLKDDLGRFQIIVKLPWGSLLDSRVKKKIELDDEWYPTEMFRTFTQASGRSTRSDEDWSITYVLDTSFYYWITKYRRWLSKQFLNRLVWNYDRFDINEFRRHNK